MHNPQMATFKKGSNRLFLFICFLPDIFCVTFLILLSLYTCFVVNRSDIQSPLFLPASSLWLLSIVSYGLEQKKILKEVLSTKIANFHKILYMHLTSLNITYLCNLGMYAHHKMRVHIQVRVHTGSLILNSLSSPEHFLK